MSKIDDITSVNKEKAQFVEHFKRQTEFIKSNQLVDKIKLLSRSIMIVEPPVEIYANIANSSIKLSDQIIRENAFKAAMSPLMIVSCEESIKDIGIESGMYVLLIDESIPIKTIIYKDIVFNIFSSNSIACLVDKEEIENFTAK